MARLLYPYNARTHLYPYIYGIVHPLIRLGWVWHNSPARYCLVLQLFLYLFVQV